MRSLTLLFVLALLNACGPKPSSPRERYLRAVNAKLGGDVHTYRAELFAVAADSPETREGRTASNALTSSGLAQTYVLAGLAGVAIPNFLSFSARSRQAEAKSELKAIHTAWQVARAEGSVKQHLPRALGAPRPSRYFLFIERDEALAAPREGDLGLDAATLALSRAGIEPLATEERLIAAAVGNLDADDEVDVWIIDEEGALVHYLDDLD